MTQDYYGSMAARPPDTSRPCWTCHWFAFHDGHDAACLNPKSSASNCQPQNGCAFWMREIGTDDEAWDPKAVGARLNALARQRFTRDRARLERIRNEVTRSLPNWMPWPEVVGRSGEVSYPPAGKSRLELQRMEEAVQIGPPRPRSE